MSIRTVLRNERGLFDLQSVMVGIIITAVVALSAFVAVKSMIDSTMIDNARSNLRITETGLKSFYMDHDRFPNNVEELQGYVTQNILDNPDFCYVAVDSFGQGYPQQFTAAIRADGTSDVYYINEANSKSVYETNKEELHCLA